MILKKSFINLLRWALRVHSLLHLLEFCSAIYETAYITASLAFLTGSIEILASVLLPNEHIHFKGFKTEVHKKCDDE